MNTLEKLQAMAVALVFFALFWVPYLPAGERWLPMMLPIVMYTVLSTSWALFSGPTHYISLATAAFFGVGAYTLALGLESLPYPVLLLLAALFGAILAALVGLTTLRLCGVYFVIFTLGLAELIRQLVTWTQNNIGGSRGQYVLTDITEAHIYWQLLALALLVYIIGWWIHRSKLGFAIRIVGGNEQVAHHNGIHVARTKIYLFMISGAFASVVGAILAPRYVYIEPAMAFNPQISFMVVIMALLGGVQRLWGPLMGALPFAIAWELINANFPNQTTLVIGLCFLLVVFYIPNGVSGLILAHWQCYRQKTRSAHYE